MTDPNKEGTQPTENGDSPDQAVECLDIRSEFPLPSLDEWMKVVEADLKGAPYEKKLLWNTPEGITIKPLYTKEDVAGLGQINNLPGFPPYTRGTQPLAGVAYPWQVRQDCLLAAPEDVNGALRDGLARGQTAIGIRLDNAVRQGFDGDSPEARELAGRGGCTLSSINGLRIALADIDLKQHPVTIRTGTSALPVLAMLVALADERGIERRMLVGAVECDPVRELVKTGTLRGPLTLHYREMADMVAFCAKECPGIRPVIVNSHPYHNAGSSATQELAYSMAVAVEYLRALAKRGIDIDTAALGILFSYSVSPNLFMEIAKLRAARTLWAKIVKAMGAKNDASWRMFLHVRSSTHTKTVYDPYNNLLRTAIEGFAAGTAGCDSMYIAPFDESIGRSNDFGMRLARNQQIILQEEAYLNRVVDPAAGSYYVEALTDAVGREAWKLFQEIESRGGMVKCLVEGTIQAQIEDTARKKRQMLATRRTPIVGVSNYANSKEKVLETRHIPREEFLAERRRRLNRLKSMRKNSDVRRKLDELTNGVYTPTSSLTEKAIDAAQDGATIGEIIRALLMGAEGEAPVIEPLTVFRLAEDYERLRDRARSHCDKYGELPKAYLIPMGPLGMRRARADFCLGFFSAGGFDVVEPPPFKTVEDAAKAVEASGARLVVICADDPSYPEIGPALAKFVKERNREILVYIAGYPQDSIEMLEEAGIDGFVHIRSNVVETLATLQSKLKVGA